MANRPLRNLTRYTNFRFQGFSPELQRLQRRFLGHFGVGLLLELRLGLGGSRRDQISGLLLLWRRGIPDILVRLNPLLQRHLRPLVPKIGLKYFPLKSFKKLFR